MIAPHKPANETKMAVLGILTMRRGTHGPEQGGGRKNLGLYGTGIRVGPGRLAARDVDECAVDHNGLRAVTAQGGSPWFIPFPQCSGDMVAVQFRAPQVPVVTVTRSYSCS